MFTVLSSLPYIYCTCSLFPYDFVYFEGCRKYSINVKGTETQMSLLSYLNSMHGFSYDVAYPPVETIVYRSKLYLEILLICRIRHYVSHNLHVYLYTTLTMAIDLPKVKEAVVIGVSTINFTN